MKIVHFIWSLLGNGGSENLLVDLANDQAKSEQVTVIVGNQSVDPSLAAAFAPSIRLRRIERPAGSRNPIHLLRLTRAIFSEAPDIIHSHCETLSAALLVRPAPMVVTVHGTRLGRSRFLRRYERVFAVSDSVGEELRRDAPYLRPVTVHNGVEFERIPTGPRPPLSPFRIVQVARLDTVNKGQDVLLAAVAELQACWGMRDIEVDFIGEGDSYRELREMAERLGIAASVRFVGDVPRADVFDSLCRYNLLVHPSRWEGFGLTVVEAMAAGVPVLVSDTEGPMEIIGNGAYGSYFRNGDARHCAQVITEIRDKAAQPEFPAQLSRIRSHACECFGIHVTARNYLEQYRAITCRAWLPRWAA